MGKILFGIDGYSHIYDCPQCNGTGEKKHPITKAREQVLKEIEVLEKKVYFAIPRADPKGDYIYPGRAETRIAYKTVAFWIEELKESLRAQQAGEHGN